MIRLLKALIRIAKNLERIVEILEIIHKPQLEAYNYYKKSKPIKPNEREFIIKEEPDVDEYGDEIILTEIDDNQAELWEKLRTRQ